ncbi:hypothetical protein GSI_06990 [Ganoderma sinense ZZ0214-1]|uniref:DUF659 domain-containing protein n=1 Tax=Ganoderma sinense ZZ0214-1 TaxID=1077348 RepID=A0A2G8SAR6_9APHY|nr:hypothetical protein GSI_06990 [Ganoderma sinense ZZ0214-1]
MTQKAVDAIDVGNMKNFIAVTTDNPTTMRVYCQELQNKYYWLLLFACFLHGMNTIIGHISTFATMKAVLSKVTRIVSFFQTLHYWGGQLKDEAKGCGITMFLKKNWKHCLLS